MINFPLLYHAHYQKHLEDLQFWQELANRQHGPVLELGCGTGRILLPLARLGWPVTGLDRDAGMLRVLSQQLLAEPGLPAHVIRADMRAFHLARRYPLVIIPCNTFSTLDGQARLETLASSHRCLAPGGLLAINLPNPHLLLKFPRASGSEVEESFFHPHDGEPVQVSSGWQRSASQVIITWHYDHLLPDGHVERTTVQAAHWLASLKTYQGELRAARLHLRYTYGDFDGSPYTPNSPSLILLANKA